MASMVLIDDLKLPFAEILARSTVQRDAETEAEEKDVLNVGLKEAMGRSLAIGD